MFWFDFQFLHLQNRLPWQVIEPLLASVFKICKMEFPCENFNNIVHDKCLMHCPLPSEFSIIEDKCYIALSVFVQLPFPLVHKSPKNKILSYSTLCLQSLSRCPHSDRCQIDVCRVVKLYDFHPLISLGLSFFHCSALQLRGCPPHIEEKPRPSLQVWQCFLVWL